MPQELREPEPEAVEAPRLHLRERAGEAACPYCREPFAAGEATLVCEGCAVAYHAECMRSELGRCATIGCAGRRALPGRADAPETGSAERAGEAGCASCRREFARGERVLRCEGCGADYHPSCLRERGRCGVPDCTASRALPARARRTHRREARPAEPVDPDLRGISDTARLLRVCLGPVPRRLSVAPDLDADLLRAGRRAYALGFDPGERILAQLDTSWLGHGRSGALFGERVCYHGGGWLGRATQFRYQDVRSATADGSLVEVQLRDGSTQRLRATSATSAAIARFLDALPALPAPPSPERETVPTERLLRWCFPELPGLRRGPFAGEEAAELRRALSGALPASAPQVLFRAGGRSRLLLDPAGALCAGGSAPHDQVWRYVTRSPDLERAELQLFLRGGGHRRVELATREHLRLLERFYGRWQAIAGGAPPPWAGTPTPAALIGWCFPFLPRGVRLAPRRARPARAQVERILGRKARLRPDERPRLLVDLSWLGFRRAGLILSEEACHYRHADGPPRVLAHAAVARASREGGTLELGIADGSRHPLPELSSPTAGLLAHFYRLLLETR